MDIVVGGGDVSALAEKERTRCPAVPSRIEEIATVREAYRSEYGNTGEVPYIQTRRLAGVFRYPQDPLGNR